MTQRCAMAEDGLQAADDLGVAPRTVDPGKIAALAAELFEGRELLPDLLRPQQINLLAGVPCRGCPNLHLAACPTCAFPRPQIFTTTDGRAQSEVPIR